MLTNEKTISKIEKLAPLASRMSPDDRKNLADAVHAIADEAASSALGHANCLVVGGANIPPNAQEILTEEIRSADRLRKIANEFEPRRSALDVEMRIWANVALGDTKPVSK